MMRMVLKPAAAAVGLMVLALLGSAGCTCANRALVSPDQPTIITEVRGEVRVLPQGATTWKQAEVGQQLREGDRIRTGDDASALVTFFEGSTIELKANTEVSIEELRIAVKSGSTSITLRQEIGKTLNRVKKLTDPASRYKLTTPSGSAVVRGTTYFVEVSADGTTVVTVTEGDVWVTAQGVTVQVSAGEQTIINPGEPPSPAAPAPSLEPGLPIGPEPPRRARVDFAARGASGKTPLAVQFTELSQGEVVSRLWDFGDGTVSTDENPTHVYHTPGSYTVTLTCFYADGQVTETKVGYIVVYPSPGAKDTTEIFGYIPEK